MASIVHEEPSSRPRYTHRPGKDRRATPDSLVLYAILCYVHGLFYTYKILQRLANIVSDTFTSFVLTSSSREMIKSDISTLTKIPSHLAVIVQEKDLEKLVNDIADLAAWSICSSIPILTIYDAHGELKGMDSSLQVAIKRKIRRYFREMKKVVLLTPAWGTRNSNVAEDDTSIPDLEVNILSREDGREAIIDITRTLCKLVTPNATDHTRKLHASHFATGDESTKSRQIRETADPKLPTNMLHVTKMSKLRYDDSMDTTDPPASGSGEFARIRTTSIDINIPFLDAHLSTNTIMEPNLLLIFSRSRTLDGFPPWSMRLCEICYVGRSGRVSYRGFLQGLRRYGRAEMRFGH